MCRLFGRPFTPVCPTTSCQDGVQFPGPRACVLSTCTRKKDVNSWKHDLDNRFTLQETFLECERLEYERHPSC